jgi:hypothetical protein
VLKMVSKLMAAGLMATALTVAGGSGAWAAESAHASGSPAPRIQTLSCPYPFYLAFSTGSDGRISAYCAI